MKKTSFSVLLFGATIAGVMLAVIMNNDLSSFNTGKKEEKKKEEIISNDNSLDSYSHTEDAHEVNNEYRKETKKESSDDSYILEERVQFSKGNTYSWIQADFNTFSTKSYVLRVSRGQRMILSNIKPYYYTVHLKNGRQLEGTPLSDDSYSYYIPTTGDYVVTVSAHDTETQSFKIEIPPK